MGATESLDAVRAAVEPAVVALGLDVYDLELVGGQNGRTLRLTVTRAGGVDLDAITVPVAIWQGSEDLMVPYAHGEWLTTQVPGVRAHLLPGEGHLSVGLGGLDEMFAELRATL